MGYAVFLFLCNILIPALMIILGRWLRSNPPKQINSTFGYRTSMSMKNMDTWNFAHELCGKLWWKIGWLMLVPSIVVQLPFLRTGGDALAILTLILCTLQCLAFIPPIVITEKALNRTFDSSGSRKET